MACAFLFQGARGEQAFGRPDELKRNPTPGRRNTLLPRFIRAPSTFITFAMRAVRPCCLEMAV
jgi:hypothetical protein